MATITRDATKSWGGPQRASTQLFSVPMGLWTGRAKITYLDPTHGTRAWARVLDGRSSDFWSGPATFGDHQTMSAITDLLVIQFFAEDQEQGSARGTFKNAALKYKVPLFKIPPLRVKPKEPWFVDGLFDVTAVPRYLVLEGAEPLTAPELARYIDHLAD